MNANGINYFGLSGIINQGGGVPTYITRLTARQAYDIDKKLDDGLPQFGRVTAMWANYGGADYDLWASGPINSGGGYGGDSDPTTCGPITDPANIGNGCEGDGAPAVPFSCYDGSAGLPEQYSLKQNNGAGLNCALSFQFQ